MTTISDALISLGITEWVIRGDEPTSEEEFNERFQQYWGPKGCPKGCQKGVKSSSRGISSSKWGNRDISRQYNKV